MECFMLSQEVTKTNVGYFCKDFSNRDIVSYKNGLQAARLLV